MTKRNALIIGSSTGIGAELVRQLSCNGLFDKVHGVSRKDMTKFADNVEFHQVDSADEQQIRQLCDALTTEGDFQLIVCCIGVLHNEDAEIALKPEKKLEDICAQQLARYFAVNTIAPMLWLKHIRLLLPVKQKSQVVMLSARVSSIQDNKLGGWYGYRASKAALNMLVKTTQVEYNRRLKHAELVCYHPGTVDTGLSKPFQANVAQNKLFSVTFTVEQLLSHLNTLELDQAPHFIDWDNKTIPW